jgi:succinate dehydrogenase flavin-adding protein (antitoxin of CptAB toxin-antitoxin module)
MEYYDCSIEEFSSLMRITDQALLSLLKSKEPLPEEMSLKLTRTTMLLIGIIRTGTKDKFMD